MRAADATDFAHFAQLRADARSDTPEALRGTAKQFEALLMQQMLKSMRAASLGDDVLGGEQTEFYQDMFDAQVSQHLAAGRGLGVADMLVRQLHAGQADAAKSGAPVSQAHSEPGGIRLQPPATDRGVPLATRAGPSTPLAHGPHANGATTKAVSPAGALNHGTTPEAFVRSVLPHAERAARELGVPARVLIAQAALETGWGRHSVRQADGRSALNLFGIKADNRWEGDRVRTMTHEYANGQVKAENADFRSYDSVGAAFDDYVAFLRTNPRYAQALRHGGDAGRFVGGLQQAGYATDPAYAQKILRIADGHTMRLALSRAATAPRTITV